MLQSKKYIAGRPIEVRVLTALKTGKRHTLTHAGEELVTLLLQACEDADAQIAAEATTLLGELQNQIAIDILCQEWAIVRSERLSEALLRGQYVATSYSLEVRVLTALKTGKRQSISHDGAEIVMPLLQACDDPDQKIATEATILLGELQDQQAINVLCKEWTKTRPKRLAQALQRGQYVVSSPIEVRVLVALKLGQRQIIKSEEASNFTLLLQACKDADVQIADEATALLGELQNQETIDTLCKEWVKTRSTHLTEALQRGRYVASSSLEVAVLTALKSERLDKIPEGGAVLFTLLLQASKDKDATIAAQAQLALQQLKHPEARETLCQLLIEQDEPIALKAAIASGYTPHKPSQRALFYFLTEQWDEYNALDFERTLLETAYRTEDEQLRSRITQKAQQAGRLEFMDILIGGVQKQRLREMTDSEWKTAISVLENGKHWQAMWELAQTAPAIWSVQLLQQLKRVRWLPKQDEEQVEFTKLAHLARKCASQPLQLEGLANAQALYNLSHTPIGQMSQENKIWVQVNVESDEFTIIERRWLKFLLALIRSQQRFDIEIEEVHYL